MRKKKTEAVTETARQDWEQTLVAEPEPGTGPISEPIEPGPEEPLELLEPAPEPEFVEAVPETPPEPVPEPVETAPPDALDELVATEPEPLQEVPAEPEAPSTMAPEGPAMDVEPALQPYVRAEGDDLILKEPFLTQAQRTDLERRIVRGRKVTLRERRWIPSRTETSTDIGRAVDALAWNGNYQAKSAEWLRRVQTERRTALKGLERIPPNILEKRIAYETEGGFVVEVTYAELGQMLRKYYTIPAPGDPRKVLDHVREGQWAEVVSVSGDVIQALETGRGRRAHTPPGKVTTWPIDNKHPVWNIHGISKKRTAHLAKIGVTTTDQLRVHPAAVVARHVRVPLKQAEKWANEAELLIVKGIAREYAYLLASAGVKGLDDLRRRKAAELRDAVNARLKKRPSRNLPKQIGTARAAGWIRGARRLKKRTQKFPV